MLRAINAFAVAVMFLLAAATGAKSDPFFNRPIDATGSWALTGSLSAPRIHPMAVTLPSGKVLVTGGFNHSTSFAKSELWDPSTGRWSATGSMRIARSASTLTVLQTGKVLVAGGVTSTGDSNTCELYDPATGKWSATGSMTAPRDSHTATLLADGRVLVAGGQNGTTLVVALFSAEIYNPSTGKWTRTGNMNARREAHAASLLANGNVLVTGGDESFAVGTKGSAEVFNPSTGRWTSVGNMTSSRLSHTEFTLADGSAIVAGGTYGSFGDFNEFASTDRYDPHTQTWSAVGDMQVAPDGVRTIKGRVAYAAVLLADGRVLAAGGIGHAHDWTNLLVLQTAELFDPASGTWSLTGNMHVAREAHAAVALPDGRAMVIGGGTVASSTATVEIFTPSAQAPRGLVASPQRVASTRPSLEEYHFAPGPLARPAMYQRTVGRESVGKFTRTGSLHFARAGMPAILLKTGKVLVEGCESLADGGKTAELYDPATGKWSLTGSMRFSRCRHSAAMLPDGRVLVVGGDGGPVTKDWANAEIYDPQTGRWTLTGAMHSARSDGSLLALADGRVLAAAGDAQGTTPRDSSDVYDPAAGTFTATPSLNLARGFFASTVLANGEVMVEGGFTYDSQPTKTVELYDPIENVWRFTRPVNSIAQDLILLPGGNVLGADEPAGLSSELYDPMTGKWRPTPGGMHVVRIGDTATLLRDGRVLVVGGTDMNQALVPQSEIYDPAIGEWTLDATLNTPRWQQGAARLPDGRVLIAGGLIGFTPIASSEIYTP